MKQELKIKDVFPILLVALSTVLLLVAFSFTQISGNTEKEAARLSKAVQKRVDILDAYVRKAIDAGRAGTVIGELPEDMVVYYYRYDTLQSWSNQFPVSNDDISTRLVFQRLSNLKDKMDSPLADLSEIPSFMNYGAKWYIVRCCEEGDSKIIAGLEIMNTSITSPINGINPRLCVKERYVIRPLQYSGGDPVIVSKVPLFKVLSDSIVTVQLSYSSALIWIGLILYIIGSVLFLMRDMKLKKFLRMSFGLIIILFSIYLWGRDNYKESGIFSPMIYADGPVLSSLGVVLIFNLAICMISLYLYIVRLRMLRFFLERKRTGKIICGVLMLFSVLFIYVYIGYIFKSIILNSSISLELYKLSNLSFYSIIIYISFLCVLLTTLLQFQMFHTAIRSLTGFDFDPFSRAGRVLFALSVSFYFVIVSNALSAEKEKNKIEVWANRLSMDRDINLENTLNSIEKQIALDPLISSLSVLKNSNSIIVNRIVENYLNHILQNYDVNVSFIRSSDKFSNKEMLKERIKNGIPISENSRFIYKKTTNGLSGYTGLFVYFNPGYGLSRMFLMIDPKSNRERRGYASIIGYAQPERVLIPVKYSYAKYSGNNLLNFNGDYAYPTVVDEIRRDSFLSQNGGHIVLNGYDHFIHILSNEEMIVISRPKTVFFSYLLTLIFVFLMTYLAASVVSLARQRPQSFDKNYYRSWINGVVMSSSLFTLFAMAAISILFVYKKNNDSQRAVMADKINSILPIIEEQFKNVNSTNDFKQDLSDVLAEIGNTTFTDITLYSVGGLVVSTTAPEIFGKMLLGFRMDETVYESIMHKHKRYVINKEKLGNKSYYAIYAPIFNAKGKIVALIGVPYMNGNYDLKTEAINHTITIFTVFIILLILSKFGTSIVVDKMFKPLIEMGHKMNSANINNPEYIIYEREDEISTLVRAYNLMVHDLSDSTKRLAVAERDKAWSGMARQVAHEIKNPLTPMKLQIQRLIRLKKTADPLWTDKFDEVSKLILDHIDILTATANEFSTFAKLYTEKPIEIDLDQMLKDEIAMFDNKENVTFFYVGLENATAIGPKPQLTRVFVNIITNAVQAVEIRQEEERQEGKEPVQGKILVALRNSYVEGYYDIVVEDNGPGVKDENRDKLFTPNFTTKSSGTGLGLAMCRSILERCNATIRYSNSFIYKGACFAIRFPKK